MHELTYVENDPLGYGDGLSDYYRCTCGEKFQANGDVVAAFEHGRETVLTETQRIADEMTDWALLNPAVAAWQEELRAINKEKETTHAR